jgi:long-chain acyl-CoA synthetase
LEPARNGAAPAPTVHGINPEQVEAALRTIPALTDALLFARWESGGLCLLVTPNLVNLRRWADQRREEYQSAEQLVVLPSVLEHVREEIQRVLTEQGIQVESFGLLHRPFLIDEGELTQAGALRRLEIIHQHGALVGAIRRGEPPAVPLAREPVQT